MQALILSDLHLGSAARADLLRLPAIQERVLARAREAERLVLLGDVLELRHGPARGAVAAAAPFLRALGKTLADREVVICPGNHDHALIAGAIARRIEERDGTLALDERLPAHTFGGTLQALAELIAPARLTVSYPGIFLREDVYAMHGHYLDAHVTIPTLERLGVGAMARVLGRPSASLREVVDYEALCSPLYAWIDAVARQGPTNAALNGSVTVRAWHALGGGDTTHWLPNGGGSARQVRTRLQALGVALGGRAAKRAFPLVIAALNRAGLGPLNATLSAGELRRAGLAAAGEVADRLGLGERYLIFGHTHRAGPLPGDRNQEWRGRGGAHLLNTGCWTYERAFLRPVEPSANPYWPGSCVTLAEGAPPRVERLLLELPRSELDRALAA
ncbi:MAG TPA: hypothetical protein VKU89_08090 [Solirubrobacteraceae bacterium]|nr:hypothetical protein [Solirubrobacteraceae bacterium]